MDEVHVLYSQLCNVIHIVRGIFYRIKVKFRVRGRARVKIRIRVSVSIRAKVRFGIRVKG